MLKPAGQPVAHGIFEPRMVQHRGIDEPAKRRSAALISSASRRTWLQIGS